MWYNIGVRNNNNNNMNNKIKMGVVEVDGIKIGDLIDDGVVVGFREVDGSWLVDIRESGEGGWSRELSDIEWWYRGSDRVEWID